MITLTKFPLSNKIKTFSALASLDAKLSVRRLYVLLLLAQNKNGLTNSEISEQANFSSTTYSRLFINDSITSGYIEALNTKPIRYKLTKKGRKIINVFSREEKL